jgi:hypothetical protein
VNKLNIFFIPSPFVAYKNRSVIKIIYALFFVRLADPKKDAVVHFMIELSRQSEVKALRLYLPQYVCNLIYDFLIKFKLSKAINFFFAHIDSGVYRDNIYCVMPMFYSDTFTVSNRGWGTQRSVSKISAPHGIDRTVQLIKDYTQNRQTKYPLEQTHFAGLEPNFFLVVMQLPWDETITQKSHVSWMQFAEVVHDFCEMNNKLKFRLRLHPLHQLCEPYQRSVSRLLELPNVTLSQNELFDELEHSKCVLLINSGVGFESLMVGKPVITFGDSIYRQFTHFVQEGIDNEEDLNDMIDAALVALQMFDAIKEEFIRDNLYCSNDVKKFWEKMRGYV